MAEVAAPATKTFPALVQDIQDTFSLLQLARCTEHAERYEDMCYLMGELVKMKKKQKEDLNVEERNMLSVAYKNVVGQRRASWRGLKADETEVSSKNSYLQVVEFELENKCNEVLTLLQNNLLKTAEHENMKKAVKNATEETKKAAGEALETQVFYLKMSGDYYRYLAEFKDSEETKKNAEDAYNNAITLSEDLPATHPTRLGLALNASVCYWEILKKPKKACGLAKKAFDEAIQKLDSLSDSTYKDSTLIMQLLRDNLTIWTTEQQDGQQANGAQEAPEDDD